MAHCPNVVGQIRRFGTPEHKTGQLRVAVISSRAGQLNGGGFDRWQHLSHGNGKAVGQAAGTPMAFPQHAENSSAAAPPTEQTEQPPKGFSNTNRFWVPLHVIEAFESEWRHREAAMKQSDGFLGLYADKEGEVYTVTSRWASIPQWEAWSCSRIARRSHMPLGVLQYVPQKGEGFPDDFAPFKELTRAVNAKY